MDIRNILHANSCVHSRRLIVEFPEDGIKCMEKLQSHCTNMTFADKSRYDRTFQKVTYKGGESAINYIKGFHNAQALQVSVVNSYYEDQIMHTFLDNFQQSGKYSAQLASHQTELRREEKYPDQKFLNISSLQTEYLNLDNSNSRSSKHNEKANSAKTKCTYCRLSNHSVEKCFKKIRKSVVSAEKMIRQTRPQAMIRMTQTHRMTVIIDASDAGARNITRKTLSVPVQL